MYENYYHLRDRPFQLNPDPRFFFASRGHRRAFAYLEYGLSLGEGFIVITGEVGAGKTTLVKSLLKKLENGKYLTAQLVSTQLDAEDTLRSVASAFGLQVEGSNKSGVLKKLEEYLRLAVRQGQRPLLIVDEAQNLDDRAIEELRMLSNFHEGDKSLLQSFLLGQPEFRDTLQSPGMLQLRQRVIASYHLSPLDPPETKQYILHRLKTAGWKDSPSFSDDAFDAIFEFTAGVPRRINTLCDRILLFGYLEERTQINAQAVKEVIADLREEVHYQPGSVRVKSEVAAQPAALGEASLEERLDNIERALNRLVPLVRKVLIAVNGGKESE